jgi:hypothetical protein
MSMGTLCSDAIGFCTARGRGGGWVQWSMKLAPWVELLVGFKQIGNWFEKSLL